MSVRQWGSERRGGAYPNKHSKQAHAVEAPAPIYLQTDHLSAHTTDHCPDPAYRMPLWLEATDTIPIHTPQTEGHPT